MLKKKLKELRASRRITQAELAEALDVSQQAVGSWETGRAIPEQRTMIRLSKFFNIPLDDLIGSPFAGQREGNFMTFADQLVEMPKQKPIPVIGSVKCGNGGLAFDDYQGHIFINESDKGEYIAFVCRGDSMTGDEIKAGDIAIVRLQDELENGNLGVVIVNGEEATLKRYYHDEKAITLQPSNPAYAPRVFIGADMNTIKIVGRVVETRRKR